jgi:hypothetical protein
MKRLVIEFENGANENVVSIIEGRMKKLPLVVKVSRDDK